MQGWGRACTWQALELPSLESRTEKRGLPNSTAPHSLHPDAPSFKRVALCELLSPGCQLLPQQRQPTRLGQRKISFGVDFGTTDEGMTSGLRAETGVGRWETRGSIKESQQGPKEVRERPCRAQHRSLAMGYMSTGVCIWDQERTDP